jgi:DNA-binding transcriptional regulator YiaG
MTESKKGVTWKPELTADQEAKVSALAESIRREVQGLRDLRQYLNLSQQEAAHLLGVTQSNISKLESGRNVRVAVLRRLIEAKGGHLKMVAEFDGREIELAI